MKDKKSEENALAEIMDRSYERDVYAMNPYGGFQVQWLQNYILDYIMQPKGESSSLIRSASWLQIKTLEDQVFI